MLAVIDTNVLVSGLLNPFGAPASVLGLVLGGKIEPVYDLRILQEYQDVLARPAFRFNPDRVAEVLEFIKVEGYAVVSEPLSLRLAHEDDRPFAEAGATAGAEYLITGNLKHFPAEISKMKVVSPAGLLLKL
jgi:predicted nucleic acid-binding protein